MAPLFSVVIVNWNTKDLLLQCLQSVYQNTNEDCFEVWVVDNASTDDSVAALRAEFPAVKLIEAGENLGFARGNNLALSKISSKYALLLNSDTLVKPDALDRLAAFMEAHPEAGGAGPLLLNPDGSLQESCYPFPTLLREFWRLFHLDILFPAGIYPMAAWSAEQTRPVDSIQGACMILRKSVLDEVGFFDPIFFMYTEEIDLCYRIKQQGWGLFWVPGAQVMHFGGQSTRKIASEMFLSLYKTKIQFFRKHRGSLAALAYKGILLAAAVFRLLLSPLAYLLRGSRRERDRYLSERYRELIVSLRKL